MKKWVMIIVVVGIAGYVGLAILNMIIGLPVSDSYAKIKCASPEMEVAKEAIGAKCLMCHSQEPSLPFYAKLPGAGGMIGKHIDMGTAICDLEALVAAEGKNEVMLSKLEQTLDLETMPILPFMLMHWNGKLTAKEKDGVLAWIHKVRAEEYGTGLAAAEYANAAVQPLPDAWPGGVDEKKVALGNVLYHDKRLSGDDTVSCATCHDLKKGGTDHAQFSTGVRNQVGGINAPTTLNSGFNFVQFWDGRAKDLADQAAGPPENPIEMDTNFKDIVGKLSKDAELTAKHAAVYGNDKWSKETITDAIAEFEKTLITPDSGVDKYLKGDKTALTETEARGLALLKEHSCMTCHAGKAMGGQSYEKPIDPDAYYAFRKIKPGDAEFGRFNVTKKEEDRYKLKVPLLRNIAITGPYLHDGNITDLKEVIPIMHTYFVPMLNQKPMSIDDRDAIVAALMKN